MNVPVQREEEHSQPGAQPKSSKFDPTSSTQASKTRRKVTLLCCREARSDERLLVPDRQVQLQGRDVEALEALGIRLRRGLIDGGDSQQWRRRHTINSKASFRRLARQEHAQLPKQSIIGS